jgi:hypothetical protein
LLSISLQKPTFSLFLVKKKKERKKERKGLAISRPTVTAFPGENVSQIQCLGAPPMNWLWDKVLKVFNVT